jgi:hypothetical protein
VPIDAEHQPPNALPLSQVEKLALGGLLALTILTRLLAIWLWWPDALTDPDAYVGIAHAIAAEDGFYTPGTTTPTAYRPPLYPCLLACWHVEPAEQRPSPWAICGWNELFSVLLVLVVLSAGLSLGTLRLFLIAASILVLDPLLIRATPVPMTELCFTTLTTAALLLLLGGQRDACLPPRLLTFAGCLLGLAALCRPTIWPFIGLYSLGMLVVHRRQLRAAGVSLAVMWLTIAVVVSPWVIRNQLVMGHPILTTTHGGYTLLLGNNRVFYDEVARRPWGTVWDGDSLDRWQRGMLAEMDTDLGPNADEVAKDRWQARRAWRHIAGDPAGFGWAVWYRVRSLWSLSPRGPAGESLPGIVRWLVALWYAALFGLAVAGAVIWYRSRQPGLWVLLTFIASLQLLHLVYWTDTRMRAPLHPVLAVLAAVAIDAAVRRRSKA